VTLLTHFLGSQGFDSPIKSMLKDSSADSKLISEPEPWTPKPSTDFSQVFDSPIKSKLNNDTPELFGPRHQAPTLPGSSKPRNPEESSTFVKDLRRRTSAHNSCSSARESSSKQTYPEPSTEKHSALQSSSTRERRAEAEKREGEKAKQREVEQARQRKIEKKKQREIDIAKQMEIEKVKQRERERYSYSYD
jgi:hypothetical protein